MATMTAAAGFTMVTLPGRQAAPAWSERLGWPGQGDVDLPFDAGTPGQRDRWAARLDAAVSQSARAVLLVAEGEGCHAAAWWARLSPRNYVARVAGAVLFHPPAEVDANGRVGMLASPRVPLPFPSLLVDRDDDASLDRVRRIATGWGSQLAQDAPAAGGWAWRSPHLLLMQIAGAVVERDLRLATTLGLNTD